MAYHGKQYATVKMICKCGCCQEFYPVPKYRPRSEGGGKWFPEYIRGHHPKCKTALSGSAWNKGLKKGDHPSIERMGFQPGHKPFNDWSHVHDLLKNDPEVREKWLAAKRGKHVWNKGTGNTIKSQRYKEEFRFFCISRDGFKCADCGRDSVRLEVHHIVPRNADPSLTFNPENGVTLCVRCHKHRHKLLRKAASLI